MKVPLRYQMTESNSGKTTLLNAICYLFDREDTDSSLIKSVYKHTVNEGNILLNLLIFTLLLYSNGLSNIISTILSSSKYISSK